MELIQLIAFESLARTQYMPQTAQELNTSQSHISKLISSLEAELGTHLFDRVGRRIVLNHRGRLYYEYVSGALKMMHNGEVSLKSVRGTVTGTIRIGEYAFSEILHPCVVEFSRQYPQIDFVFTEVDQSDVGMLMNTTDLLIMSNSRSNDSMTRLFPEQRQLFSENSYVAVSPKLRRFPEGQTTVSPEELSQYPLIESRPSPFYQDQFFWNQDSVMTKEMLGTTFRIGFTTRDFFSKLSLLDAGVGIAFFPEVCLANARRFAPDLQFLSVEGHPMSRRVLIARKQRELMGPAANTFWDFMLDFFGLDADSE